MNRLAARLWLLGPAIGYLAQIQQQHLAIGSGLDVNDIFVIQRGTVTFLHRVPVQRSRATSKLHPCAAIGSDCVLNHMARTEARGVEADILVNPDGTVVTVRITNQAEAVALFSSGKCRCS